MLPPLEFACAILAKRERHLPAHAGTQVSERWLLGRTLWALHRQRDVPYRNRGRDLTVWRGEAAVFYVERLLDAVGMQTKGAGPQSVSGWLSVA